MRRLELFDVPQDVILLYILLLLSLKEIAIFRRTCRAAFSLVAGSKQLWSHVFREEVSSKNIRLPLYRSTLEEVGAIQLEAWIRSALTIYKNYDGLSTTEVSRMDGLGCITWIKLVRGRWLLVACSDRNQSRLLLLDILRDIEYKKEIYFFGPIMDGQIYESDSGIDLALSIGTKIPSIDILRFGAQGDLLSIQKLASISSASFTRLLRGTLVGFAVRYDDDSFPHILDWKSGISWILKTKEDSLSSDGVAVSIDERGMCYAITEWNGFFIAVFSKMVQIFIKPEHGSTGGVLLALCNMPLGLPEAICEAEFRSHQDPLYDRKKEIMNDRLYIFVRQNSCRINILELECEELLGTPWRFNLFLRGDIRKNPQGKSVEELNYPYAMSPGSTGSAIVWCGSRRTARFESPCLIVNRIYTYVDGRTGKSLLSFGKRTILPRDGIPMLHHFPYFDFDDGRGIVALGTSIGELAVVRFTGSRSYVNGCLNDKIPSVMMCLDEDSAAISLKPIPLDLPAYYKWQYCERDKAGFSDESQAFGHIIGNVVSESQDIPLSVIEELFSRPNQPRVPEFNVQGWSNNWTDFEFLEQWVVPTLRWGCRDYLYEESGVMAARISMPFLADPIPLFYEKTHGNVIFRVGRRLYLLIYASDGSGSLHGVDRINSTLESLSEYAVENMLSNNGVSTSVTMHGMDMALLLLHEKFSCFDFLVRFLKKHGMYTGKSRPEEWSAERWKDVDQLWNDISAGRTSWLK